VKGKGTLRTYLLREGDWEEALQAATLEAAKRDEHRRGCAVRTRPLAQYLRLSAQLKQQQMQIEKERIQSQEQIEGARIGLKAEQDKRNQEAKQQYDGIKIGSDVAIKQRQMDLQASQRNKPTRGE
jgi:hypothetical protein